MRNHSKAEVPLNELPAIVLHEVSKTFKIKHTQSFKESFIAKLRGQQISTHFNAVENLSVSVPSGQSIAILGRNGSGKSTTLKMLSGVMQPDKGWIRIRGRVAGLLEVGAGFHPNLTGRENVYLNAAILGMSKEETDSRFESILEFSEIGDFIDTEVKHYSSGMYSRLGFAVAVHTELDVLLVDEVLSVGDAQFREKCNERMLELQDVGKTMFVVSHNADQVQKLCERGIVLDNGRMVFDGPIEEAVDFMRPKKKPIPGAPEGGYPIRGEIKKIYDLHPLKFGRPIQREVEIQSNGGGFSQTFENGIIATSRALGVTAAVYPGSFLNSYLGLGGPSGPWGFPIEGPRGTVADGNRSFEFQHGTARFTAEDGVWFEPHVIE